MSITQRVLAATCIVGMGILLALPSSVSAQTDDVTNTKHNLSITSGGSDPTGGNLVDYGQICVYCHTPHNVSEYPLWNRGAPGGPFTMYSSSTIQMTIAAAPQSVSAACLGCHDGTIGLDVITTAPHSFTGTPPSTVPGTNTMPAGPTNFGTDLSNDHPISVTYNTGADAAFHSIGDATTAGARFYGSGTVECGSCHNPHNSTWEPFLRTTNDASALCLACHIK